MKSLPSTSKIIAALLSFHLLMPAVQAWAPVSAANVSISIPTRVALSEEGILSINQNLNPAPTLLKTFSETIVNQLSEQQVFTSWAHSELQYFPLGPGTHSWLVTVSKDKKELGYLILTAKDTSAEEYVLSEYGTSASVPYHVTSLHQTLEQLELIPSSSKKNIKPITIEPLYSPLLPLWKVSYGQQETLYLNALTMEVLPWDESHWKNLSMQNTVLSGVKFSTMSASYTSSQPILRKGQRDPLDNLMWITSPKLALYSDQEFESYINQHNSLIFTSPNRNDEYGGPFAISGFQKWHSSQGVSEQTIYAGTGLSGQRYVPLSVLRTQGEFHAVTK